MKICVFTYGCRVNSYESDAIAKVLRSRGHVVVDDLEYADIYIVNTCAVTAEAERKSRQSVSRIKKINPNAKIIVCGCASQKDYTKFQKEGVRYISGTADKGKIADLIEEEGLGTFELEKDFDQSSADSNKAKIYLKIQDGCNNFCSYCIIPYLRGRARSRTIERCIEEIENTNTKEVVLTGINLSAYGRDIGVELTDLIERLSEVDKRISLGSLEVGVINRRFLQSLKNLKDFCPHFHLSLQSGSNSVLAKMNRKYTREEYLSAVRLIEEYFENPSITTDVIVGFPTESEEDFLDTVDLCKKCAFSDVHVFPYSKREGTVAYKLGELNGKIVKDRAERLEKLRDELRLSYRKKVLGKPCLVLVEEKTDFGYVGYSDRYVRVYLNCAKVGEIREVVPQEIYEDGVKA
ncbi:MAG: tRNA (N(6)-L-threonylcarbamoyladenosine(37)-C(2))-methylthiotransferase MtaB [Clostridia bacterium]|nr:tRNA (N(6)-L-threonylcarbamoyladenosine(37)-C(2))-methylthiotransferase MtaB [Clostridia bacterium]